MSSMKLSLAALLALGTATAANAMQFSCETSDLQPGQTTVCTAMLSVNGSYGNITFIIDGQQNYTVAMDNQGHASFTTPANLAAGNHQIEAAFYGGQSYGEYHGPENAYTEITVE